MGPEENLPKGVIVMGRAERTEQNRNDLSLRFHKQLFLARIFRGFLVGFRTADHRQHIQLLQVLSGNKDPLRVAARIRRRNKKPLGADLGKIIGHQAFQNVIVSKFEPHPEPIGAGTAW